jgi:hypothetical protein
LTFLIKYVILKVPKNKEEVSWSMKFSGLSKKHSAKLVGMCAVTLSALIPALKIIGKIIERFF